MWVGSGAASHATGDAVRDRFTDGRLIFTEFVSDTLRLAGNRIADILPYVVRQDSSSTTHAKSTAFNNIKNFEAGSTCASIVPQGNRWIDPQGPPRRNVARHKRNKADDPQGCRIHRCISRVHTIQQRLAQPRQPVCCR